MAEANSIVCRLLRNVRPSMQAVGVLRSAGRRRSKKRTLWKAELTPFLGGITHFWWLFAENLWSAC